LGGLLFIAARCARVVPAPQALDLTKFGHVYAVKLEKLSP
jgi:hypothetical protein